MNKDVNNNEQSAHGISGNHVMPQYGAGFWRCGRYLRRGSGMGRVKGTAMRNCFGGNGGFGGGMGCGRGARGMGNGFGNGFGGGR